jgi:hypothetical protein
MDAALSENDSSGFEAVTRMLPQADEFVITPVIGTAKKR